MMRSGFRLLATPLVIAALSAGCGDDPDGGGGAGPTVGRSESSDADVADLDPATVQIREVFTDSSVPPEFHRSYTVTVADGQAVVEVSDYDTVLATSTVDVGPDAAERLLDELAGVGTGAIRGDCTGGPTRAVLVVDAATEQEVFRSSADTCSDDADERFADLAEAMASVHAAVDLGSVIASTTGG